MKSKERVQEFITRCDDAMSGGDSDPYALMSKDVLVKVHGRTIISGDHPGLEIVQKVLVDSVIEQVARANVEIVAMIGDDHRVAAQLRLTGETHEGESYNPKGEPTGCVFYVDGDKISRVDLFLDNTMVETVLLGRRYVPTAQGGGSSDG